MINQDRIDRIKKSDRLSPGQKEVLIHDEKNRGGGRSSSVGNVGSSSSSSLCGRVVEDFESVSGIIEVRHDQGRYFCIRCADSDHPHIDGKSFDNLEDAEERAREMIRSEEKLVEESVNRLMGEF